MGLLIIDDNNKITSDKVVYRLETLKNKEWQKIFYYTNPLLLLKNEFKEYVELAGELEEIINDGVEKIVKTLKKEFSDNNNFVIRLNENQIISGTKIRDTEAFCITVKEKDKDEFNNTGDFFYTKIEQLIRRVLYNNIFKTNNIKIGNIKEVINFEIEEFLKNKIIKKINIEKTLEELKKEEEDNYNETELEEYNYNDETVEDDVEDYFGEEIEGFGEEL